MAIKEQIEFAVGMVLLPSSLYTAFVKYYKIEKENSLPKGTNLDTQLPEKLPSIIEIKKVIPLHCFDPKLSTSMYYALKDVVLVTLTFFSFAYILSVVPTWAWFPCLYVYWCIQGTLYTSLFVIGHDCGHDSFSHYWWLNDIIGTIFHSYLLTPYYMWKVSHRIHHKNTGNFEKDEVFYPATEKDSCKDDKTPPGFAFGIGWFIYLVKGYKPRQVPHFDIHHKAFKGHTAGCILTIVALFIKVLILTHLISTYGFLPVLYFHLVPIFIFGCYIVVITFLHHSEFVIGLLFVIQRAGFSGLLFRGPLLQQAFSINSLYLKFIQIL